MLGSKNPDYKIDGEIFDNYAPTTDKPRSIWTTVKGKVDSGQTNRLVLNLDDTPVNLDALTNQFQNYPISGLQEVLIIRNGSIVKFYP